jgi:hypothetical protein
MIRKLLVAAALVASTLVATTTFAPAAQAQHDTGWDCPGC